MAERPTTETRNQRNKLLGALVVGILVLSSIAVYQQFQLSALLRTISLQSSELANPASGIVISNFTITKQNATDAPVMYLVFSNNGTAPASSGTLLVGDYGQSNAIRFCYNDTQNVFPIYVNESAQLIAPLSCGSIGDPVSLTATVNFLTGHGSLTKVYSAKTTIALSKFQRPSTVTINQIGILTFILPFINNGVTYYQWSLTITNYASKSIVSLNATATSPFGSITGDNTCTIFPGALRPISDANPLTPHTSCQINSDVGQRNSKFSIGTKFLVAVSVVYSDGSKGTAITTAIVEPPYIILKVGRGPFL